MNVTLDDFGTGWVGVAIELTMEEADLLIVKLTALRSSEVGHFHIRSNGGFDESAGVADISFSLACGPSDKYSVE